MLRVLSFLFVFCYLGLGIRDTEASALGLGESGAGRSLDAAKVAFPHSYQNFSRTLPQLLARLQILADVFS